MLFLYELLAIGSSFERMGLIVHSVLASCLDGVGRKGSTKGSSIQILLPKSKSTAMYELVFHQVSFVLLRLEGGA